MSRVEEFRRHRERMNARIHAEGTLNTKRFFALDERCYEDGATSCCRRRPRPSSQYRS